jgi:hypothetical protein
MCALEVILFFRAQLDGVVGLTHPPSNSKMTAGRNKNSNEKLTACAIVRLCDNPKSILKTTYRHFVPDLTFAISFDNVVYVYSVVRTIACWVFSWRRFSADWSMASMGTQSFPLTKQQSSFLFQTNLRVQISLTSYVFSFATMAKVSHSFAAALQCLRPVAHALNSSS